MTSSPDTFRAAVNWAAVMAGVPRERYIPDRIWRHERGREGNDLVPVDRASDPAGWAALVAADTPVDIQVDHGRPCPDGTGWEVTSSASDRRVVADMLTALNAQPGERILEIGTGTGWNAALLAAGGAEVTTIEIDAELAAAAATRLDGRARVINGDGQAGDPAGAPYDRLIATVGVATVPPAWVRQVRPGGRLVVPLTGDWQPPGIAILNRTATGASGRLGGSAAFMGLRGQATPRPRGRDATAGDPVDSTTDVHPSRLTGRDTATTIGLRVPAVCWAWNSPNQSHRGRMTLFAAGAWATLSTHEGRPFPVRQAGRRRLFDEALAGYNWWLGHGRPAVTDWLVRVDANGHQTIELSPRV